MKFFRLARWMLAMLPIYVINVCAAPDAASGETKVASCIACHGSLGQFKQRQVSLTGGTDSALYLLPVAAISRGSTGE